MSGRSPDWADVVELGAVSIIRVDSRDGNLDTGLSFEILGYRFQTRDVVEFPGPHGQFNGGAARSQPQWLGLQPERSG